MTQAVTARQLHPTLLERIQDVARMDSSHTFEHVQPKSTAKVRDLGNGVGHDWLY